MPLTNTLTIILISVDLEYITLYYFVFLWQHLLALMKTTNWVKSFSVIIIFHISNTLNKTLLYSDKKSKRVGKIKWNKTSNIPTYIFISFYLFLHTFCWIQFTSSHIHTRARIYLSISLYIYIGVCVCVYRRSTKENLDPFVTPLWKQWTNTGTQINYPKFYLLLGSHREKEREYWNMRRPRQLDKDKQNILLRKRWQNTDLEFFPGSNKSCPLGHE